MEKLMKKGGISLAQVTDLHHVGVVQNYTLKTTKLQTLPNTSRTFFDQRRGRLRVTFL
jgi:hypothetical protein